MSKEKLQSVLLHGDKAIYALYFMVTRPHNFDTLDDRLKSLFALYKIGDDIKQGIIKVLGSYVDNHLYGINYGVIDGDVFLNHTLFDRHVKYTVELTKLAEAELKKHFPDIKLVLGAIPEVNRAGRIFATRMGYENKGIDKRFNYIHNGEIEDSFAFEKEI